MNVYLAELVGTALLILFGNGVVANIVLARTKGNGGGWICITAGWAFAVAIAVFSVGRISGAHVNPAVTIALASIGSFDWALVPGYIAAQMAGATLWIVYGALIGAIPVVVANGLVFAAAAWTLFRAKPYDSRHGEHHSHRSGGDRLDAGGVALSEPRT